MRSSLTSYLGTALLVLALPARANIIDVGDIFISPVDGSLFIGFFNSASRASRTVSAMSDGPYPNTTITHGLLHLTDAASFTIDDTLKMGHSSTAMLIVDGGSQLTVSRFERLSDTEILVDGPGSTWTNFGFFVTPEDTGTFELSIVSGASVTARGGILTDSTILVSGADSEWVNTDSSLFVKEGSGVVIESGAAAITQLSFVSCKTNDCFITVQGAGSTFESTQLSIGRAAQPPGVADGRFSLLDQALAIVDSGVVVWPRGTLRLEDSELRTSGVTVAGGALELHRSTLEVDVGDIEVSGVLTGGGVIGGPLTNSGTVRVVDELDIAGDYSQGSDSELHIVMGEPTSLVGNGLLDVAGTAEISGDIRVTVEPGFSAIEGESFEIARYGTRQGEFDFIYGPAVPGNVAFDLSYGPTSLVLEAGPDGDSDGVTDANDPCPGGPDSLPIQDRNGDGIFDGCQCGDATRDGFVTSVDVGTIALCLDGIVECNPNIVDATGDGTTSILDLELVFRTANGSIETSALNCSARAAAANPSGP